MLIQILLEGYSVRLLEDTKTPGYGFGNGIGEGYGNGYGHGNGYGYGFGNGNGDGSGKHSNTWSHHSKPTEDQTTYVVEVSS